MINTAFTIGNTITLIYLLWRAKDAHWHSQAEWELLRRIGNRKD